VGQGLLIVEVLWWYSDAAQSVGLFWTSDQPNAETSTWQHTTFATDKFTCFPPPLRVRNRNPKKRAAADPCALDREATRIGKCRAIAHKIKPGIIWWNIWVTVCDCQSTSLETRDWAIHVLYNQLRIQPYPVTATTLWFCVYWHRSLCKNVAKICD
jgi:hypothetical protein